MLDQCWATVVDDGPTLIHHCVSVSCLSIMCHELRNKYLVACRLQRLFEPKHNVDIVATQIIYFLLRGRLKSSHIPKNV